LEYLSAPAHTGAFSFLAPTRRKAQTVPLPKRLRDLGQSDDQIFALAGDWKEFAPADRTLFKFARHLAATPIALTDGDVAEALSLTGPRQVVQLINFVTSRAYFDRVTEAAGLPLDL
jgi:alkylhydroperoxidase family enzyme